MIAVTDWRDIWVDALRLAIAYILALPIGRDRERPARSAGLRTFPLAARPIEGPMTGDGFIGGAILKQASEPPPNAASLRAISAVGAAVGCQLCDSAIVIPVATLRMLRFGRSSARPRRDGDPDRRV